MSDSEAAFKKAQSLTKRMRNELNIIEELWGTFQAGNGSSENEKSSLRALLSKHDAAHTVNLIQRNLIHSTILGLCRITDKPEGQKASIFHVKALLLKDGVADIVRKNSISMDGGDELPVPFSKMVLKDLNKRLRIWPILVERTERTNFIELKQLWAFRNKDLSHALEQQYQRPTLNDIDVVLKRVRPLVRSADIIFNARSQQAVGTAQQTALARSSLFWDTFEKGLTRP